MLALLILSEAYDGESVSCFSPSFLGFAQSLVFLGFYFFSFFFFFFFFFFFYFILFYFFKFYFIFKLNITVLDLPNIKMNLPQVYMCSPS